MLNRIMIPLITLVVFISTSWGEGRNFGLGFVLGEPTALSAKYWMDSKTALDFGLGWGLGYNGYDDRCWDGNYYNQHRGYCNDNGYYYQNRNDRYGYRGLHFHADYLFHNFNVIRTSEKLPIYYGPGVSMNFWNHGNAEIGLRGVLGIAWMPRSAPIDLFFELAPVLEFFPGTWVDINAGIGARFYF
jgi:hypothetical protein